MPFLEPQAPVKQRKQNLNSDFFFEEKIRHLMFDRCNPEKSQLVCRIKVSHLLVHNEISSKTFCLFIFFLFCLFIFSSFRLLSDQGLAPNGPHDEMSSKPFGKICSKYGPHKKEKEKKVGYTA